MSDNTTATVGRVTIAPAPPMPDYLRAYFELERRQLIARLREIERILAVASEGKKP